MRILFILIFCSAFIQSAVAKNIMSLNTTALYPLHRQEQKGPSGFLDEVLEQVFKDIGYDLELVVLPAERGLFYANSGELDGDMPRVEGLEKLYPNLVRVPEKLMEWKFSLFTDSSNPCIQNWQALKGQSVAFINGWKILEKNVPRAAEVTKVRKADQLFNLLNNKRVDYIIYEYWMGNYQLKKLKLQNLKTCSPPLVKREMFVYLNKKHKNIVPLLTKALIDLKKSGKYDQLVSKHLMPLEKKGSK